MNKKSVIEHLKAIVEDKSLPKESRLAVKRALEKYSKKRRITKDDWIDIILFLTALFEIFVKK